MVRLELSSNKPLPLARLPRQFAHATSHEAARKILKDGPKLPRRSRGSCPLEGLAFAVSLHPEAWMEIAGTGPAIVVVEFSQPALDFHRFRRGRRVQAIPEVRGFAVQAGLVELIKTFLVWYIDENDEERYFEFEEGHPDLEYYRTTLASGDADQTEVVRITESAGWKYLPRLHDRIREHYVSPDEGCLEAEVVNLWLMEEHPKIGMVWYEETLDPLALSAPRGAILPDHFSSVKPIEVIGLREWESQYA